MPTSDTERIFELLQSMDSKMTLIQQTTADALARISSLEAWRSSTQDNTNRFWAQTWPAEQKLVQGLDERLRLVERDAIRESRLDDMETVVKDQAKAIRDLELAKEKSNVVVGILAAAGGGGVAIATSLLTKFFGG